MSVTVAVADFEVFATLVALTVAVACDGMTDGGVYSPVEEIVPALADQVTDPFVLPETEEENC